MKQDKPRKSAFEKPLQSFIPYPLISLIEIYLKKSTLLTTIPKQSRIWELSFDFTLLKVIPHFTNIVRFTVGCDAYGPGCRTPTIFMTGNYMYVVFNTDTNTNHVKQVWIDVNKKIKFKIRQVAIHLNSYNG